MAQNVPAAIVVLLRFTYRQKKNNKQTNKKVIYAMHGTDHVVLLAETTAARIVTCMLQKNENHYEFGEMTTLVASDTRNRSQDHVFGLLKL